MSKLGFKPGRRRKLAAMLAAVMAVALSTTMLIGISVAGAGSGSAGSFSVTVTNDGNGGQPGATDGTAMVINATFTAGPSGQMSAHLCPHGQTYLNNTEFALGAKCAPLAMGAGESTKQTAIGPTDTSKSISLKAGVGSQTWIDANDGTTPHTINCGPGHTNCDLVVAFNVTSGFVTFVDPLVFAGTAGPTAPTSPTIAAPNGDGLGNVVMTWLPGSGVGGTVDNYRITATFTGGMADPGCATTCTFNQAPAGGNTGTQTATLPLHNFSQYTVTVATHVSDTTPEYTGPSFSGESTPARAANPNPLAPGTPTGTTGDSFVDLSWTAPTYVTGLVGYQIVATPVLPSGPALPTACQTGTGTTFHYASLTNGTQYSFVVNAFYGGTCVAPTFPGPPSSSSAALTPSDIELDQLIIVNRPQGALVYTQACDTRFLSGPYAGQVNADGTNPYPTQADGTPVPKNLLYPVPSSQTGTGGPTDPNYNPSGLSASGLQCSVNLGNATFVSQSGVPAQAGGLPPTPEYSGAAGYPSVGEGQFFKADGQLKRVAVVDTRDTDSGWNVYAKLKTRFYASGAGPTFSADALGFQPGLADRSPPFTVDGRTYANNASRGIDIPPANTASVGTGVAGLGSPQLLGKADPNSGLGIAHFDALLHVLIPVWAQHGVYSAILQITAI